MKFTMLSVVHDRHGLVAPLRRGRRRGLVARTDTSSQHVIHHGFGLATLFALCLILDACGTPVSVERMDAGTVQNELTSNALTTGRLSESTQIVLRRLDLLGLYNEDRPAAIRSLSIIQAAEIDNRDLVYALAEMAFLQAEAPMTGPISLRRLSTPTHFCFLPRLRIARIRSIRACEQPPTSIIGRWLAALQRLMASMLICAKATTPSRLAHC